MTAGLLVEGPAVALRCTSSNENFRSLMPEPRIELSGEQRPVRAPQPALLTPKTRRTALGERERGFPGH